ncbi:hypothetical protein F5X97DRAFT_313868 [Nemania serpens]|nr:hypothetical protein F5X97DRAFT_313868 [Nemania serpens]
MQSRIWLTPLSCSILNVGVVTWDFPIYLSIALRLAFFEFPRGSISNGLLENTPQGRQHEHHQPLLRIPGTFCCHIIGGKPAAPRADRPS